MMTQIAYAALTLGVAVALALPVEATTRRGCDDVTDPLCVPFGATEGDEQGSAQRGTGR
jgi:hypothetical protein